jgi:ribosome biogenesis protein ENP2
MKKQKKREQIQMRVSSSSEPKLKAHHELRRSFGSRAENLQPIERRRGSAGGVVGDKMITFEPAAKKKAAPKYNTDAGAFRSKERRSASGNTFRRM